MNTFGARRCNHEVMLRGAFANVRIKNLMVPGVEGGVTVHQPSGEQMGDLRRRRALSQGRRPARRARRRGIRHRLLARLGGEGPAAARNQSGRRARASSASTARISSAWASCPASSRVSDSVASLGIDGTETFDLTGVEGELEPRQDVTLTIHRKDGSSRKATVTLRADTPIEIEYLRHGGILPFVLREIMATT